MVIFFATVGDSSKVVFFYPLLQGFAHEGEIFGVISTIVSELEETMDRSGFNICVDLIKNNSLLVPWKLRGELGLIAFIILVKWSLLFLIF